MQVAHEIDVFPSYILISLPTLPLPWLVGTRPSYKLVIINILLRLYTIYYILYFTRRSLLCTTIKIDSLARRVLLLLIIILPTISCSPRTRAPLSPHIIIYITRRSRYNTGLTHGRINYIRIYFITINITTNNTRGYAHSSIYKPVDDDDDRSVRPLRVYFYYR